MKIIGLIYIIFIIADPGNLDIGLGFPLEYFHNDSGG
jgi:hypothetical protein